MTFRNSTGNTFKTRIATSRTIAAGTLLAAMLGTANIAQAADYTFTLNSSPANYDAANVTITGFNGTVNENTDAGLYSATLKNNETNASANIAAYCVDFTQNIYWDTPSSPSTLSTLSKFNSAFYNYGTSTHTSQDNADALAYLLTKYSTLGGSFTKDNAANVQVAIWDIVDAGGNTSAYQLNSGTSSAVTTAAINGYISEAYSNLSTGASDLTSVDWVQTPKNGTGAGSFTQDFAFGNTPLNGNPNFTNTPEPGSVAMLMGLGATGVGFLRRRRAFRATK